MPAKLNVVHIVVKDASGATAPSPTIPPRPKDKQTDTFCKVQTC